MQFNLWLIPGFVFYVYERDVFFYNEYAGGVAGAAEDDGDYEDGDYDDDASHGLRMARVRLSRKRLLIAMMVLLMTNTVRL